MCKSCSRNPVYLSPINNVKYCKSCFSRYFEKKVRKTIRTYNLISKQDRIGIAVSGGKDSLTALFLIHKILKSHKLIHNLVAFTVDEGIKSYKKQDKLKNFCRKLNIELKSYSYREEFGFTMDAAARKLKIKPCSLCGVLRRQMLNKKAKALKITKLITGHNLDDEAQTILMNQFRNNIDASSRLGPITGVVSDRRFVRRIKPLYFMLEDEVKVFAKISNLPFTPKICPYRREAYRNFIADMLNKTEKKYPGTKYAIVNSFLNILPLLKTRYSKTRIKSCKICHEPCSQEICQACKLLKQVSLKIKL